METKLKRNLAVQVIKDHNISKIEIDYSGGGDDGCLDAVRYEDINGNNIDVKLDGEVEAEWDDLLYNMLSENIEWDWINNDGGYGQMTIDCTKTPWKVNINHTQRVCEDHYYDCDFDTEDKQHFF
tara:strand:+ start:22498 stop:22872 length:375 start_codon:yes stop_codon:yes gene_type:complete